MAAYWPASWRSPEFSEIRDCVFYPGDPLVAGPSFFMPEMETLLPPPEPNEECCEISSRKFQARVELQCSPVARDGALVVALSLPDPAQIIVSHRVVRIEFDGFVETSFGFREQTLLGQLMT